MNYDFSTLLYFISNYPKIPNLCLIYYYIESFGNLVTLRKGSSVTCVPHNNSREHFGSLVVVNKDCRRHL